MPVVLVGNDKKVYCAGWLWPGKLIQSHSYPVEDIEESWQEVQAGGGELVTHYRDVPPPPGGSEVLGKEGIDEVSVGYILTYNRDMIVMLQPVIGFSGTADFSEKR